MPAWKSFVVPLGDHPNLTVTTGALATRILLQDGRAIGVEYTVGDTAPGSTVSGTSHRALARAEVIVSAGTIGSPKLLLLSGIGPAEHLRDVGVPVTVDLPGVGENLHDHLLVSNTYESRKPVPAGVNNLLEAKFYSFSRGATTEAPDLQPLFLHLVYPAESYPVPEQGYTIAPGLVAPKSRGTLRLASTDPAAAPLVDPNILSDPYDLEAMVDAAEMCREIGQAAAFDEWRGAEVAPDPSATIRDELRDYVRRAVGTHHHRVGTCKMGDPDTDASVVVTPELKVVGVQGLRVIDASIIPTVPAGNTNAPSIMIGEKGSDLILNGASS
uniref:GMC family oxidoreductase n=1 Tax=Nakamurella panacisegetis TaxID=1090615 RepID=UPI000A6EC997|nr:GMC oxidoreductase [Nakamurella panacisegetis]